MTTQAHQSLENTLSCMTNLTRVGLFLATLALVGACTLIAGAWQPSVLDQGQTRGM